LGGAEQLHHLQSLMVWFTELLTQNIFELALPGIWQNAGAEA
jgi:hypothetical protein